MNFIKLRISNPFFNPSKDLILCNGKPCIIYGKNGSGKSTISKSFRLISGSSLSDDELTACLVDANDNEILLNEESKRRIFVFDEDFILDNVKFKKDGLKSIVIIGDNIKIDEQIDTLESKNKDIQEKIIQLNTSKYVEKKNPFNVEEAKDKIFTQLKRNGGYAERGREIIDGKNKIKVTDETLDAIINEPRDIAASDLQTQYKELINLIEKTRGYETTYDCSSVCVVGFSEDDVRRCLEFSEDISLKADLKKKFEEVSLNYGTRLLSEVKTQVNAIKYCPLCLRDFESGEREDFLSIIDAVFDDKVKHIIDDIEKYESQMNELALLTSEVPYSNILDSKVISEYNQAIANYNNCLSVIRRLFKKKKDNPKSSMLDGVPQLNKALSEVLEKHESIKSEVDKFNDAVKKRHENENKAKTINLRIAYCEVKDLITSWKKLLKEQAECLEKEAKYKEEIEENHIAIRELRAQKKNHSIAIGEINRNLTTIFSSKNRLRLSNSPNDESVYEIYCRNTKAKPRLLSTGERNAIALCYFYEKLKEDRNKTNAFSEETTVIIDDPITSLDYETKSGILSFVKKIVKEVSDGNEHSGVVVLTHELETVQQFAAQSNSFDIRILTAKKQIEVLNPSKFSVYGFMMRELYDFAVSDNPDLDGDETIYNRSRRVLEGFSSFMYRNKFDYLFDPSVLNTMLDNKAKEFFSGTSSSRELNSESHLQYWMKRFPDNIETLFDGESAQKLVRQCILLLYHLNPLHVLENIVPATGISNNMLSREDVERNIKRWGDDLF